MVIDKPLRFPISNLTAQRIRDILLRHFRAKLEISTPTLAIFLRLGNRFKEKRLLKDRNGDESQETPHIAEQK